MTPVTSQTIPRAPWYVITDRSDAKGPAYDVLPAATKTEAAYVQHRLSQEYPRYTFISKEPPHTHLMPDSVRWSVPDEHMRIYSDDKLPLPVRKGSRE